MEHILQFLVIRIDYTETTLLTSFIRNGDVTCTLQHLSVSLGNSTMSVAGLGTVLSYSGVAV